MNFGSGLAYGHLSDQLTFITSLEMLVSKTMTILVVAGMPHIKV